MAFQQLEERNRRIEEHQQLKDQEELKECTFKPRFITKASTASKQSKKPMKFGTRSSSISHSVMQMPQPRHEELFISAKEKEHKLELMRREKHLREKNELDFKPKISQKSRDLVKKRMAQCTVQSAAQIKKVNLESLGSTVLSNLNGEKSERKCTNTNESDSIVQASQTWYSFKNLSKQAENNDGDDILSNEEVGGQGMMRSLGTNDNLPKTIVVPSQIDLLYQDALQRQKRKKRLEHTVVHEECTFQPNVNRSMTVNNLSKPPPQNGNHTLLSGSRTKAPNSKAVTKRLYGQAAQ